MRILVLTNLYPPHHAGAYDFFCESVTESLRLRGHEHLVLTSTHGLRNEQRDSLVHRRLTITGAFGCPAPDGVQEMKAIELANNRALTETIESFQPEAVHVFSLSGLSKSLIFTLYKSRLPIIYAVYDHWLSAEVREDPWLRFWNAPSLSLVAKSQRAALELSGERGRLDDCVPTRMAKGYDRLPGLYGSPKEVGAVAPNSLAGFRFDHLYFCSQSLKSLAEQVGFCVWQGAVIYPGISSKFFAELKPLGAPVKKLLVVAPLDEQSGVMTAFNALKIAREARLNLTLSVYGRGESSYIAKLRSYALTSGLPVEFLNVPNQNANLPSIFKAHDLLLHTPEWAEPFPFTPLEAMGCGVPVIGAAVGSSGELLRHGENALSFVPGDAADLAARIQEIIISPALRRQMAETAQADALGKFNETTVIDQIENFLVESQTRTE